MFTKSFTLYTFCVIAFLVAIHLEAQSTGSYTVNHSDYTLQCDNWQQPKEGVSGVCNGNFYSKCAAMNTDDSLLGQASGCKFNNGLRLPETQVNTPIQCGRYKWENDAKQYLCYPSESSYFVYNCDKLSVPICKYYRSVFRIHHEIEIEMLAVSLRTF
ncbi:hypothetical protein CROQUDRAFT_661947 [Cronartium quercuum f. sp. fusiforme G11]|uniref:Secreted protein n=1 Tax=Cronartium quercuum f. sp. fusiforme G11 TaxID=708437 RepID=A0A9P6T8T8_9BASI|nr:hypothetical protein CROQUDRAFT_661947 [Cronartium quercuum f. sp. fusiforme G11]